MGEQFYRSGKPAGSQYNSHHNTTQSKFGSGKANRNHNGKDEDLIIEDNTVYEIDRECYERLKRQRKR